MADRFACYKAGCAREAVARPVLKFWAIGHPKSTEPMTMEIGLNVCAVHRRETTIDALITDESWDTICVAARALAKMPPSRSSGELHWAEPQDPARIKEGYRGRPN